MRVLHLTNSPSASLDLLKKISNDVTTMMGLQSVILQNLNTITPALYSLRSQYQQQQLYSRGPLTFPQFTPLTAPATFSQQNSSLSFLCLFRSICSTFNIIFSIFLFLLHCSIYLIKE